MTAHPITQGRRVVGNAADPAFQGDGWRWTFSLLLPGWRLWRRANGSPACVNEVALTRAQRAACRAEWQATRARYLAVIETDAELGPQPFRPILLVEDEWQAIFTRAAKHQRRQRRERVRARVRVALVGLAAFALAALAAAALTATALAPRHRAVVTPPPVTGDYVPVPAGPPAPQRDQYVPCPATGDPCPANPYQPTTP